MSILSIVKKLCGKWHLPAYALKWYPSSRSCASGTGAVARKPSLMPPLMVRRAEWRR